MVGWVAEALMMDARLEKAVNQQINNELQAWYTYLSMAAYCDTLHLTGCSAFMEAQSREEQMHAHRLIRYVLDRGGRVDLAPITPPKGQYGSLVEVFRQSMAQEQENTKAIYRLYDLAREVNDYATIAA